MRHLLLSVTFLSTFFFMTSMNSTVREGFGKLKVKILKTQVPNDRSVSVIFSNDNNQTSYFGLIHNNELVIENIQPCRNCNMSITIKGYEQIRLEKMSISSRETILYKYKPRTTKNTDSGTIEGI